MADTVRRVEYRYATVPDSPGEVQKLLSTLEERGVNLVAFLGFPEGGQSQIDLVPEDPAALTAAAEAAGVQLSEAKQALLVQGDDRVGAVADVTGRLAEAGVNVTAAAAVAAASGSFGMVVWVAPGDYEQAAGALGA
jgi:predicted amino acid-binding ACT domain protein